MPLALFRSDMVFYHGQMAFAAACFAALRGSHSRDMAHLMLLHHRISIGNIIRLFNSGDRVQQISALQTMLSLSIEPRFTLERQSLAPFLLKPNGPHVKLFRIWARSEMNRAHYQGILALIERMGGIMSLPEPFRWRIFT
jgi:hypothetical protein